MMTIFCHMEKMKNVDLLSMSQYYYYYYFKPPSSEEFMSKMH